MNPPQFSFFIADLKNKVSTDSRLWKLLLSGSSKNKSGKSGGTTEKLEDYITIGAYFTAASAYLSENNFSRLKKAIYHISRVTTEADQLDRISLFLVKHGAFYHPVRAEVSLTCGRKYELVLNGAVSSRGRKLARHEYSLMARLNNLSYGNLPVVYDCSDVAVGDHGYTFFLGQWMTGFQEFHWTVKNGREQVVVWGGDGSATYIEKEEAFPIFGEAAKILTQYFDPYTFQEIFPWHHAAGDFIIRKKEDGFAVRLITVRGYDNRTDFDPDHRSGKNTFLLPALLVFFLNLSLRMRLDRLDGTGAYHMADNRMLVHVIEGFLSGLSETAGLVDDFVRFFLVFDLEQIFAAMFNVLEIYPLSANEADAASTELTEHCAQLQRIFKDR